MTMEVPSKPHQSTPSTKPPQSHQQAAEAGDMIIGDPSYLFIVVENRWRSMGQRCYRFASCWG